MDRKIVVFGSPLWPGCEPVKECLSQNNIKFAYVNITESMFALKQFLKYRDNRPEFNRIKKSGSVGIPCIVVDNQKIYFEDQLEDLLEYLK